jgi:uncharacterized membrane protein
MAEQGEAGPGKERMLALTDGIFAFAMTLLVLGIGVPDPASTPAAELGAYLRGLLPEVGIFALSFVMCGVFWVGHHQQFHLVRRTDRTLLWLNIGFCMAIALLPFTTGTLGHYPLERSAILAYGADLLLTGLMLNLMRAWLSRARLLREDLDPLVPKLARRRMLVNPVLASLAMAASFVDARASLLLLFILPVYYIRPGRIDPHLAHGKGEHG